MSTPSRRHTVATRLLALGMDITDLQRFLGRLPRGQCQGDLGLRFIEMAGIKTKAGSSW